MVKLFGIITEIAEEKEVIFNEHTDLIDDLRFDSLKFIELISEIEDVFQIEFEIEDIDIDKLRSVIVLRQLIEKKMAVPNNN